MGKAATADLFGGGEVQALPMSDDQRALIAKIAELQEAMTRTLGIAKDVFEMGSRIALSCGALTEKEKKPHAIKIALTYFDDAHKRKFDGEAATINGGQDSAIMKRLLSQHGPERVNELIDQFFDDDDEWLRRTGYTVGNFSKRIPGLIATSKSPARALGLTQRTAMNGQHARTATDMIKRAYSNGNGAHR